MITKSTKTLESWTIAIAFNEPQTFEATSSELEIGWNCQRTILLLRSLEFNSKLKGPDKSYFPTFMIPDLSKNDLPAPNGIFLFDEHIEDDDANRYDINSLLPLLRVAFRLAGFCSSALSFLYRTRERLTCHPDSLPSLRDVR